jgi:catechol 2,3-dioxygenase-like lactoylglutathione lyase family enzyme
MGLRLTEIVVDCRDPAPLASFWAAALGYHVVFADEDQVEIGPWEQEPLDRAEQLRREPGVPTIVFVVVPEGKTVKNRLHVDVRPEDDFEAEVRRLLDLGARRADIGQGSVPWAVLADPEGNEFCVLGPLKPAQ